MLILAQPFQRQRRSRSRLKCGCHHRLHAWKPTDKPYEHMSKILNLTHPHSKVMRQMEPLGLREAVINELVEVIPTGLGKCHTAPLTGQPEQQTTPMAPSFTGLSLRRERFQGMTPMSSPTLKHCHQPKQRHLGYTADLQLNTRPKSSVICATKPSQS